MNEEQKEIRAQRHDFIKEYYKMATSDLDRHLKAGWQTIAVLAGGVAILAAGHEGKIGFPVATTLALIAAFWGTLTVIDANYWSLRAIGFLSNVEAVYFSVADRRNFNPYIGKHPPYKLLNSLKYMFWLCVAFACAIMLNLAWSVYEKTSGMPSDLCLTWQSFIALPPGQRFFWGVPILAFIWGVYLTARAYRTRLGDYSDFSHRSPGPGVRINTESLRHVTMEKVTNEPEPAIENNSQDDLFSKLEGQGKQWKRNERCLWWVAIACTLSAILLVGIRL